MSRKSVEAVPATSEVHRLRLMPRDPGQIRDQRAEGMARARQDGCMARADQPDDIEALLREVEQSLSGGPVAKPAPVPRRPRRDRRQPAATSRPRHLPGRSCVRPAVPSSRLPWLLPWCGCCSSSSRCRLPLPLTAPSGPSWACSSRGSQPGWRVASRFWFNAGRVRRRYHHAPRRAGVRAEPELLSVLTVLARFRLASPGPVHDRAYCSFRTPIGT